MAKVAICLATGFEDSEFDIPHDALREAGHKVVIVGTKAGVEVHGKNGESSATIDKSAKNANIDDFDAIVIPGGLAPEVLRQDAHMVQFVRDAVDAGKVVAAVCHGPQLLIEAGVVRHVVMTSWPSIKTELIAAGAKWVDKQVVEHGVFITSRNPGDLEAFSKALLQRLSEEVPTSSSGPESLHF